MGVVSPAVPSGLVGLKERVAVCCRLLHQEGILNYSGHVSARVPGQDALLVHAFAASRAAVSAESVLACDFEGRVLPGSTPGKPPIEVFIHTEIYRARPDVQAIVHTHSELAAVFTLADVRLLPMKAHAVRWASGVPVHPDPTHIETSAQGRELAATLGQDNAALLRAHGGVLVAESLEAVLVDAVHFDENMRAQQQAQALGRLLPLTAEELARLRERSNRDAHVDKLWRYFVGKGVASGALEPGAEEGM